MAMSPDLSRELTRTGVVTAEVDNPALSLVRRLSSTTQGFRRSVFREQLSLIKFPLSTNLLDKLGRFMMEKVPFREYRHSLEEIIAVRYCIQETANPLWTQVEQEFLDMSEIDVSSLSSKTLEAVLSNRSEALLVWDKVNELGSYITDIPKEIVGPSGDTIKEDWANAIVPFHGFVWRLANKKRTA